MRFDRRRFLKLLGLGGAAAVATRALPAQPPTVVNSATFPVLSADEVRDAWGMSVPPAPLPYVASGMFTARATEPNDLPWVYSG